MESLDAAFELIVLEDDKEFFLAFLRENDLIGRLVDPPPLPWSAVNLVPGGR